MLPDNVLSSEPVVGRFMYDMGIEPTPELDFKPGGIALQDPSQGLEYQIWRGMILNPATEHSRIVIDGRFNPQHELIAVPNIIEFSFSFDFNMRPMCVYVTEDSEVINNEIFYHQESSLYWYDNTVGRYDTIPLGSSVRTPKLFIDDPRLEATNYYERADVCLFYWQEDNLYVRYLRDRFTIPTLLKRNVLTIKQAGMNEFHRVQVLFQREIKRCQFIGVKKHDCKNP